MTQTAAKKYTITGDTLREVAISFGQLTVATGTMEIRDSKAKEPKKYGLWSLNDGSSGNPYDSGVALEPEESISLETSAGAPLKLSVEVVLRQLTPKAALPMALAARTASKAATIARLKAQLANLEG